MKVTGYVIGGLGLHSGAAAVVFYLFNMAVWSALTALLGGGLALIGLGLIMWALYPLRKARVAYHSDNDRDDAEATGSAQPA